VADPHGATRVAGVVGWPVEHSLSPAIHNAAYAAMGLDQVYVAFPVPPGGLPEALAGLAALGVAGVNVTMPHKEEAAALAAVRSGEAERLAAANVLTFEEGEASADNTDAAGFARFLLGDAGFDPAGRSALVFGAGGAARACALALARAGIGRLTVAVREAARADTLLDVVREAVPDVAVVPFDDEHVRAADLLVNATPLGQSGEHLPAGGLHAGQWVVDLVYRPALTPLVAAAKAAGARAFGGLGMLLHQAALTIELWTGRVAPLAEMSAAALAALAEDPRAGVIAP
jgi:shikimate dehydrogenase